MSPTVVMTNVATRARGLAAEKPTAASKAIRMAFSATTRRGTVQAYLMALDLQSEHIP
jgi:hypothetical protein